MTRIVWKGAAAGAIAPLVWFLLHDRLPAWMTATAVALAALLVVRGGRDQPRPRGVVSARRVYHPVHAP